MTDNEIIKALECCGIDRCDECPCYTEEFGCDDVLHLLALDLINRQKAEIEEKPKRLREVLPIAAQLKAEAVKEFAERLVYTLCVNNEENTEIFDYDYTLETIDNLVKEFTEGG